MNFRLVGNILGKLIIIIGISMTFPLFWDLIYGEGVIMPFLISCLITISIGLMLFLFVKPTGDVRYREGFILVALAWTGAAFFGALPYYFADTFYSFADAFFESMSGFTTTGASVMTDIEQNSQAILLWRSITHWLGGLGIVVLYVALLSQLGIGAMKIVKAEVPGPVTEKIKPRISETAKIFLGVYLSLTLSLLIILLLLGLSFFDALVHTFGTVATGGFSSKNSSVAYFGPAVQWAIAIFMFLSGANFALYYLSLQKRSLKMLWRNEEFRFYSAIVLTCATAVTILLAATNTYDTWTDSIRAAFFQVISIITTTGFATTDYNMWPIGSLGILIFLMFIGGCLGSTGGGLKVGRHLIMVKQMSLELKKAMHPRAFLCLKLNNKQVPNEVIANSFHFFYLYVILFIFASIYMTILGYDLITSFSAVAASIGNIGPGLGQVGPAENFAFLPSHAKYVHAVLMLLGRLEIYTILVLLIPGFWRKG